MKMKTIIFIITALIAIAGNIYSQTIPPNWSSVDLGSYNEICDIQFIDDKTGFIALKNVDDFIIKKTTNRGNNWTQIASIPAEFWSADIYFINENLGFMSCNQNIYKYSNGVLQSKHDFGQKNRINKIIFASPSTGYALLTYSIDIGYPYYTQLSCKIFKTNNYGETWIQVKNIHSSSIYYDYRLNDIDFDKSDHNKIVVCGFYTHKLNSQAQMSILVPTTNAYTTTPTSMGLEPGSYSRVYVKPNSDIILLHRGNKSDNPQYSRVIKKDWQNIQTSVTLFQFESPTDAAYNHNAMDFFDDNLGYMIVDSKVGSNFYKRLYRTSNGGYNWNVEFDNIGNYSVNDHFYPFYIDEHYGFELVEFSNRETQPYKLYIRNLEEVSIFALSNGISYENGVNIIVDGNNYVTPSYGNSIKPFSINSCPNQLSNDKIFYKWNDNTMKYFDNPYMMPTDKEIEAIYKTKLRSTTAAAISNPPQTKAIRDTTLQGSNTIVHAIHESMGGIFYSRSTDNGNSFSREEIVNRDLPDGNKNSCLTVMRALGSRKPLTYYNENKNVTVAWERYNQGSGKTELIVANRTNATIPGDYEWEKYYDYQTSTRVFSSFNSNSNFNSTPKVFVSSPLSDISLYNSVVVVPHLRLNGNNTKMFVTVRYKNKTENYEIDNGNISDLAVSAPYNNYSEFMLHFAYKKDGHIIYRKEYIGHDVLTGTLHRDIWEVNESFSHGDGVTQRYTPDISLRNGLPVIAYKGMQPKNLIINYEDGGESTLINYNDYPIIVKFKRIEPNPYPHEVWSGFFWYSSAPYSTQQNPNVEGSKDEYAHLLNFSVNNSLFKQFVRIDGYNNYHCTPATFTGNDAKLIRGSYQGLFATNSHPSILTLSPEAPLFKVGKQSFVINNNQIPIGEIDAFSNLAGVVEKNDLDYKFTLGPLFANNQVEFDDDEPPQSVQTVIEFNDEMVSDVFWLSDFDTLILGANGSYIGDLTGPFEIIRYDVNLINYTTGEPHRLLFHDTVNVEDSVETEFLRGFIIEDIQGGADSFYVELVVNPDDIGGDEDYGMGGNYDGGDGGGDALNWKVKVFFEGDNIPGNTFTPKEYDLMQNYPNPFNPTTTITYDLPRNGNVKLVIYDMLGREVSRLVNNEFKSAGRYSVVFNGSSLSSGIYFYRIEVNNGKDFMKVKRMVLIK